MAGDKIDGFAALNISTQVVLEPREPEDDLIEYRVEVTPLQKEDYGEPVGHFIVWRFNIGSVLNGGRGTIFELFDARSQEALELYETLFDMETDNLKDGLTGGECGPDLIYFQWAEFPPELRRSNAVLAAAERTIQVLGCGCSLAALWPWDNPHPDITEFTPDKLLRFFQGQKANEEFWGRIGFSRFENTTILTRDLTLIPMDIEKVLRQGGGEQ
jgi:hypothetical protein